ncbi:MAG TPA: hypothetical protein VMW27_22440 [Thermoanaerobaculia bacterium]|nr:hypothetical protein [Thermoanaerobaculia bacterium]
MALNKQQLTLVGGLGLGAGLMYLLDPQGGRSRRTAVKDKTTQALSTSGNALRKTSKSLGSRSKDLAAGVRSKLSRDGSDSSEDVQALDSGLDSQSHGGKLEAVRKWGGSAARVLAGTAGAGLAVAGARRRDKLGAALGAVGLGLLAGSGAGQRLLALRHRGNGSSQEELQSGESNSSLQAGSVTVNESETSFATLGDTQAASELPHIH